VLPSLHLFGVSSPALMAKFPRFLATSFDSSGWMRTAGYGNVYLPFQSRRNVTHGASALSCGAGLSAAAFYTACAESGHECPFCRDFDRIRRDRYARMLHNAIVFREMTARLNLPGRAEMELEHTFHTRHDFTPELGWAAFQLLAEIEGVTVEGMGEAARTLASPMARRSDLRKLLRSMDELGLLSHTEDKLSLSNAGRALADSAGRYEPGFFAGIHCLYAWGWLWGNRETATPSWSYRQVCREIRAAGPLGIEPDAIALKVAAAGEWFGADRVSFSRSSVNG
jgi:hypothetical protein